MTAEKMLTNERGLEARATAGLRSERSTLRRADWKAPSGCAWLLVSDFAPLLGLFFMAPELLQRRFESLEFVPGRNWPDSLFSVGCGDFYLFGCPG